MNIFTLLAYKVAFGVKRRQKNRTTLQPAASKVAQSKVRSAYSPETLLESSQLKVESPKKTATATDLKTLPVFTPPRSGRKVGGKARRKAGKKPDKMMYFPPTYIEGPLTTEVIGHVESEVSTPPPPIKVGWTIHETGSSKRLDMYKKMYKGSTFELRTPRLTPANPTESVTKEYRASTCAGYGRSNVHNPYWLHDHYASSHDKFAYLDSCFNRSQLEDMFDEMFKNSGVTPSAIESLLSALYGAVGGDQRIDVPVDYFEVTHKYFNNNVAMPIDLKLYLCQPKKDLKAKHTPMNDWFDPGSNKATAELMLPDYYYQPVLTAGKDAMYTLDGDNNVTSPSLKVNARNIMAISTEVVPEATPQSFSQRFRENWDVRQMQPFTLLPQQELEITLRVKFKKCIDIKRFLANDTTEEKWAMYEDLTLFPMVKFQGQDTTAVSSTLKRTGVAASEMNRFITTTAPNKSASMLSHTASARCKVHVKGVPVRGLSTSGSTQYNYTLGDFLDIFDTSKRELRKYDDVERGVNVPYYQVNDNLGYFNDAGSQPSTTYYYTQVCELKTKDTPGFVLPVGSEPATSLIKRPTSQDDWGVVETTTVSTTRLEKTGSDIRKMEL